MVRFLLFSANTHFQIAANPTLNQIYCWQLQFSTEAPFFKRRILIMSYPTGNATDNIKSGVLDAHTTQRKIK
jgi:hypothetical protein